MNLFETLASAALGLGGPLLVLRASQTEQPIVVDPRLWEADDAD